MSVHDDGMLPVVVVSVSAADFDAEAGESVFVDVYLAVTVCVLVDVTVQVVDGVVVSHVVVMALESLPAVMVHVPVAVGFTQLPVNVTDDDVVDDETVPEVTVQDGVVVVPLDMVQATESPLPLAAVQPLIEKTGPPLPDGQDTALDDDVPEEQPV